jgi:L-2,4-diaminobutyric acid acetyltransferase
VTDIESNSTLTVDRNHTESSALLGTLPMRMPDRHDAAGIHQLISQCPPLDQNSLYTYLLLSEHFRSTCIIAHDQGALAGFVSAYIPPGREDVLFVWQVAVHQRARGKALGKRMLHQLLLRPELSQVTHIETTVGPENRASRAMFAHVADELRTSLTEQPLFERELFGQHGHDDEPLLRIGPLRAV